MTAQTVISAKYPPHIDVTRAPLAFGDRAIPRLVSIEKIWQTTQYHSPYRSLLLDNELNSKAFSSLE